MSLFNKLFSSKSEFKIRYSKTEGQWQVYKDMHLLYTGTKEMCERFIKNSQVAAS